MFFLPVNALEEDPSKPFLIFMHHDFAYKSI